jgi:hypothetical protein
MAARRARADRRSAASAADDPTPQMEITTAMIAKANMQHASQPLVLDDLVN